MKKYIILLLILLAFPLAEAASLYREDFSRGPAQSFNLKEKDAIRINISGKETEIMLRSIFPEKSSAKLTIFIEGAETPKYATIQTGSKLFLDLNRDKQQDLVLQAFYISKDSTILSISNLNIENPPASPPPLSSSPLTGKAILPSDDAPRSSNSALTGIIITLSIILLGLLVYFIVRKK